MLVLTRKRGEEIRIGENIILVVTRISGNKVHIGINAPANVLILRGEIEPHDDKQSKKSPDGPTPTAPTT